MKHNWQNADNFWSQVLGTWRYDRFLSYDSYMILLCMLENFHNMTVLRFKNEIENKIICIVCDQFYNINIHIYIEKRLKEDINMESLVVAGCWGDGVTRLSTGFLE